MPCWDSLLYTRDSTPPKNAKPQEESPEIKHLESRIHKLTEMLCELCSRVEAGWPDEQHCSCVPILRKLLKDAERERDEAREIF